MRYTYEYLAEWGAIASRLLCGSMRCIQNRKGTVIIPVHRLSVDVTIHNTGIVTVESMKGIKSPPNEVVVRSLLRQTYNCQPKMEKD